MPGSNPLLPDPILHDRLKRAHLSLSGLSIGDAFGELFFCQNPEEAIRRRELPPGPWPYTDDTVMAISIVEVLERAGKIDPDLLGERFAARYFQEPGRGYGHAAHDVLAAIGAGQPWRQAATSLFGGEGSMGNGGAMRAAPIGAYFAGDIEAAADNGRLSAMVTHAHPEGQAGAIAVAVAAAIVATQRAEEPRADRGRALLETVIEFTPAGPTRDGLVLAMNLPAETSIAAAVAELGNGSRVMSPDTVPFAIWCAARHLDDYKEALWNTVSGLGDRDTTCAIVGGIVSLAGEGVPSDWREKTEKVSFNVVK